MAERFTVRFKFEGREHETRVLVESVSFVDNEVRAAEAALAKAVSRTARLEGEMLDGATSAFSEFGALVSGKLSRRRSSGVGPHTKSERYVVGEIELRVFAGWRTKPREPKHVREARKLKDPRERIEGRKLLRARKR